jgi:YVTN family beta-propeller protein
MGGATALGLILVATAAHAQPPAVPARGSLPSPQDKLLLVASRTDSMLTVFRARADQLAPLKTIPTGKGPDEVVITADGRTAYVSNAGDDSITVVDLGTLTVARTITHPRLQRPSDAAPTRAVFGLAVTPDGKKLYVAARAQNAVFVMSPAGDVIKEIPVADVSTIALSPDGGRAYAVSDRPQQLTAVDTATDTVVGTVKTGRQPKGIAFTPDGKTLVLAAVAHDALQFLNARTLEVEATIGAGRAPQSPVVSPDGRLAFVGTRDLAGGGVLSSVSVVDLRRDSPRQVKAVLVGSMANKLVVSDDGAYLYVTCTSVTDARDTILALDLLTMEIARYARGGAGASGMAFRK